MEYTSEFPSKIDSSILSTFDSCKHRGFREYIQGLTPRALSPDLHAGGAFARGIEVTRLALWRDNKSLTDALLEGAVAMLDYWGDYEPPEKLGKPHIKSLTNTVAALYSYFEEYPYKTDTVQPYFYGPNQPAVEFSFALEMNVRHPETGEWLLFCGRCDLIGVLQGLVTVPDGTLAVVDEKTTTALGPAWPDKWIMRGQFLGYCKAGQEFGLDITTALIRGVAFQVKEFKHMQAVVQFGQWQIDRWWLEANEKAREMVTLWNNYKLSHDAFASKPDTNEWPHSYADACDSYGGCPFKKNICTSENSESWLTEFDVRRWDPLAKNPAIPVVVGGSM